LRSVLAKHQHPVRSIISHSAYPQNSTEAFLNGFVQATLRYTQAITLFPLWQCTSSALEQPQAIYSIGIGQWITPPERSLFTKKLRLLCILKSIIQGVALTFFIIPVWH
jgi:hypothetical protein